MISKLGGKLEKINPMIRMDRDKFELILSRFEKIIKNSSNAPSFFEYANETENTKHELCITLYTDKRYQSVEK